MSTIKRNLRRPLLSYAVLSVVGAAGAAQAQTLPTETEVVVTGRGLAEAPGDRVVDVVTIDRARLVESASGRLESVLADVAGLQQFRRSDARSANPTSQGITLRGLGGNAASRVALLLDGVPQADPFGGWVVFPALSPDRLGNVRVTRGGGSGYQGPGALAGTIELDSAAPTTSGVAGGRLSIGSRDAIETAGTSAAVMPGGFAGLSAAYARGDGFVPTVARQRGSIDRAAPYRQMSAAVRTVVRLGAASEIQANLSAFDDRRNRGTDFTDNRSQGADASLRLVGRGRWGWSTLMYVQSRAFASSFAAIDAARTTATRTLDQYNTPATGLGGRIELAPPIGRDVHLRIGGDIRALSGKTQELYSYVAGVPTRLRTAGGDTRTIGAFVDGSADVGAVTLALGARIDRWRIDDGFLTERPLAGGVALTDARFAARSGTETTGRIGASWRLAAPLTVRAAAYRGWRLPTLNELYRPFRVGADATAANAGLRPERLSGHDIGVTMTPAHGVRIAATWYDDRLTDAIANVTAGAGPGNFAGVGFVAAGGVYRMRQNIDVIRARGVEIDAEATRGIGFARLSFAHAAARIETSGAAAGLDGRTPAQTPRDQVSANAGARRGAMSMSATIRHVSRQFDDDQNSRSLAAATTIDLYAAMPISRRIAIEARAENVADARVEAGISGAGIIERATPRTLWIGLRLAGR